MNKIERLFDRDIDNASLREVTWLPVGKLCVRWDQSQRTLIGRWADEIADNFDPDLLGLIFVSQPSKGGIYHVIDGHHRSVAVQKRFGKDELVPCVILSASDPIRAAQIFDRLNTQRKAPSAIDKFKVRVTGKSAEHLAVSAIVEEAGFEIKNSPLDGFIRATEALMFVYKRNGAEILALTLKTIKATWGMDNNAMSSPIINGYASFLAQHGDKIDIDRFVDRMSKDFTPGKLIGAQKALREAQHGTAGNAVRVILIHAYNKGLRSGKLPT